MKFPKNRENCYIALRDSFGPDGSIKASTPCGVFAHYDDCEDFCGALEQEWREKMGDADNVAFRPFLNTFYG